MTDELPAFSIPEDELRTIDIIVDSMAAHMRRLRISVDRAILFLNINKEACDKIDEVIATGFAVLQKKGLQNPAEKLFDRIWQRSDDDDPMKSLSYISLRMIDTMEFVLALKKTYRGIPFRSGISEKEARDVLKKRRLLR